MTIGIRETSAVVCYSDVIFKFLHCADIFVVIFFLLQLFAMNVMSLFVERVSYLHSDRLEHLMFVSELNLKSVNRCNMVFGTILARKYTANCVSRYL